MRTLLIILSILFYAFSNTAYANMKSLMDSTFNAMSNSSSADIYKTHSRTVMNAGSLSVHTSIVNPHLVSFTPPYLKGGCGGLDFFGGSLSFISADQFRELLRQIGGNSVGYLAEVALDSMCPTCVSAINTLQDRLQKMNRLLHNSCQTSKWLMHSTGLAEAASQIGHKIGQKANELAVQNGYLSDPFAPNLKDQENGLDKLASNNNLQLVTGNIVYQALQAENALSWFPAPPPPATSDDLSDKKISKSLLKTETDKSVYELIQSITGTIVVEKEAEQHTPKITVLKPTIGVSELIKGGSVQILTCDNEQCTSVNKTEKQIEGFDTIVRALLLGNDSSIGIVEKVIAPATPYTEQEKRFINFDPLNIVSIIINVARESTLAREIARDASPIIAQALAVNLMTDVRKAVNSALSGKANHAASKSMGLLLQEIYTKMYHELQEIQTRHSEIISRLNNYRQLVSQIATAPKTITNETKDQ